MKIQQTLFIFILALLSWSAVAETTKVKGDHELHYNVFPSTFISPQVAKTYGITRSKNKGMINLSVLKRDLDSTSAVEAEFDLQVKNLLGQKKSINLKLIKESDGAIYYVGVFPVSHRETVNFKLTAKPKDSKNSISVEFSKEFYTD